MSEDLELRAGDDIDLVETGGPREHASEGVESPAQSPEEPAALPSDVLVEAMSRSRRIRALNGASVPAWLMTEPIELALAWLQTHGKRCENPMQSSATPGPLRPLLKMRPAARKQHQEKVHAALWRYASSPMVEMVRSEVRARHERLVGDIESGALFEADGLRSEIHGLDESGARDLAAALWSTGLHDLRTTNLFRLLPALVPVTPEKLEPGAPTEVRVAVGAPPEKPRHREKRVALEREISDLETQLSAAREDRRTRAEAHARVNRKLDATTAELEAAARRIDELEKELQDSIKRGRATDARLREVERSRQESSAASNAYRTDLERAQAELAETEAERSALVRRVASAQARVQGLEAELRAIPRHKDAIADWLHLEEARLRELEHTVEGGARERVAEAKRLRRKLEQAFLEAYPDFRQDRPAVIGRTRSLTFRALGGGTEVGRSAYLISIGSHNVLIDCGIAVGALQQEEQLPDLSTLSRLDALLVTHAHTDHIGWIPALVASLEYFPIYCTRPTAELLPVMLRDSRSHYERKLADEQLKRQHNPAAPDVVEAYTRDDIFETETRLLEARVGEGEGVGATDLIATFFPAGHVLGAASVLLEGGGRRVVVSGDISADYQHTVGAFNVPEGLTNVDLLVLESTYGDRIRPPVSVAEDELVGFVADAVNRGIALLPCFALGRAQEVLAILKSARRAQRLPADLKILVDGMINKINPIYIEHAKLDRRLHRSREPARPRDSHPSCRTCRSDTHGGRDHIRHADRRSHNRMGTSTTATRTASHGVAWLPGRGSSRGFAQEAGTRAPPVQLDAARRRGRAARSQSRGANHPDRLVRSRGPRWASRVCRRCPTEANRPRPRGRQCAIRVARAADSRRRLPGC